jgi:phosphoglycerate dehydrogenase-like enzyme
VIHTLAPGAKPSAEQMEQAEVLMAYSVPPGVLGAMPKLRWAQAMTAGVEGWIALPDLPPVAAADLRARHARGVDAGNIIGALLYVANPMRRGGEPEERKWVRMVPEPLTGKTLGILGVGVIGQKVARIAATLGMRVIGTRRRPAPVPKCDACCRGAHAEVLAQSDFVLLLMPAPGKPRISSNAGGCS